MSTTSSLGKLLVVAATAGTLRVSGSSSLSSTSFVPSPNDDITRATERGLLGSARQCADTARIALPLSMVLVVVFCLPNVTPSAPCRRALKVSGSRPSCLRLTSLFPQRVSSLWTHMKNLNEITLVGNTGLTVVHRKCCHFSPRGKIGLSRTFPSVSARTLESAFSQGFFTD